MIGPGSVWENGLPWMSKDLEEMVADGDLTPVEQLVLQKEDKQDYEDGFVFERTPDVLTQGHTTLTANRADLVAKRVEFSEYLLLPTKYPFKKSVRILSICAKFLEAFKKKFLTGYSSKLPTWKEHRFEVYCTPPSGDFVSKESNFVNEHQSEVKTKLPVRVEFCAMSSYYNKGEMVHLRLSDDDVQDALGYLYGKATAEVLEFNKKDLIEKTTVEKNGILYHKSRILEGQRFGQAGGLEGADILQSYGINVLTPVIDRYSPLAYSIGDHIHTDVAKHAGYES